MASKSTVTLLLLLSIIALSSAKQFYSTSNGAANEYYFEQKLDHTRPVDKLTWQQRYFVMNNWFNATKNPLVILYICGEGECNNVSPNGSFVSQIAQNFSGIVFSLEHRFYGKSQPFGYSNSSYALEHLQYLSAEQALYDLAWFINFVKQTNAFGVTADMPWVTIGGSYPGALSAWFRSKFPYLTIGALASSAVVNSIDDFFAFDQQVSDDLLKGPGNCREIVHDLNVNITKILQQGSSQEIYQLKSFFNSTKLNDGDFLFYLSDITVMGVQYGSRVNMCNQLLVNQTFEGVLQSVASYALQVGVTPDQYGAYYLRNTTYSHERNARQWYYQVCSEFGWLFTPAKSYPMRSTILDMEYWASWCARSYAIGVYPNQNATNNRLGGLDLETTNLIFTNGGEDPWQWASKRTPSLPGIQSYVADCDQCAHCVDLHAPSSSDSQVLKDIRAQTVNSFAQWVNEHYAKLNAQKGQFIRSKIINNFVEQI